MVKIRKHIWWGENFIQFWLCDECYIPPSIHLSWECMLHRRTAYDTLHIYIQSCFVLFLISCDEYENKIAMINCLSDCNGVIVKSCNWNLMFDAKFLIYTLPFRPTSYPAFFCKVCEKNWQIGNKNYADRACTGNRPSEYSFDRCIIIDEISKLS